MVTGGLIDEYISGLTREVSLLREVLGYSQKLGEFIEKRQAGPLLACLESRAMLLQEILALEEKWKFPGYRDPAPPGPASLEGGLPEAGRALQVKWLRGECQALCRAIDEADRSNYLLLSAWRDEVSEELSSIQNWKTAVWAYGKLWDNNSVSFFLDRHK